MFLWTKQDVQYTIASRNDLISGLQRDHRSNSKMLDSRLGDWTKQTERSPEILEYEDQVKLDEVDVSNIGNILKA